MPRGRRRSVRDVACANGKRAVLPHERKSQVEAYSSRRRRQRGACSYGGAKTSTRAIARRRLAERRRSDGTFEKAFRQVWMKARGMRRCCRQRSRPSSASFAGKYAVPPFRRPHVCPVGRRVGRGGR